MNALNREWSEWSDRYRGSVRRWSLQYGVFADCGSLDDVLSAVQLDSDAALRALLTEVSNDDEIAARVVLQSLIGRVVRMAVRDPRASVDDYISALWFRIRDYPLASRPHRIAANLSMDTFKTLRRELRWMARYDVIPFPPDVFTDETRAEIRVTWNLDGSDIERDISAQAVLGLGRDRHLIDGATHDLLASIYLEGLTPSAASRRHWSTPGAVRVRCSRAVRVLAHHARDLVDAA